jgi:hypothetical protein
MNPKALQAMDAQADEVRERTIAFTHWFTLNTGYKSGEFEDLTVMLAQRDALRGLVEFAGHKFECAASRNHLDCYKNHAPHPCTCGFDKAEYALKSRLTDLVRLQEQSGNEGDK